MPINVQRLQSVFLAAAEIGDPADRAKFLDGACDGDTELRTRVEALLRAHDQPDSLLDQPAVAPHDGGSAAAPTIGCEGRAATDDEALTFLAPPTRRDALGRLGHYEALQVLGRGGFGIVFRAFDETLQRVVALKIMAPQLAATSPARKRFLREARSSAQVRHENVVQVYEVAEEPLPYLVMEFIPGETLQQKLHRVGPLDVPEVLRIGRQIAEGLAAAHATDLIHRDIKPSNVLLEGGHQKVKITDFGLARAADDASISQSGIIAGTPMYMAPEQAKGDKLDQRADLFSLGSVLYVMVSGRPPFRATATLAVLKRVAEDTPRPIREIIPETPQWLCDIIAKLHAKKPDHRYQSAREVADVLADCEAQLKASSKLKDYSRIPRSRPQRSGRRKWVAAVVAVLLPVIALAVTELAGVTHWFRGQEPPAPIQSGNGPTTPIEVAKNKPAVREPAGIDLIPLARPDPKFGTWTREGDTLVSIPPKAVKGTRFVSALPIPVDLPREFVVEAVFERTAGDDGFTVTLTAFGAEFMIVLDVFPWSGFVSGLRDIAGKSPLENETGVRGRQIVNGQKHTLRCTVRAAGVTASLDGKELFDYRGGYGNLDHKLPTYDGVKFSIRIIDSPYRIHSLRLIPLDGSRAPATAPSTDADRRAAEYMLSIGGTVKVNGREQEIKAAADLPRDAFRLTTVSLFQKKKVTDAGLAAFKDCKNLLDLNLHGTAVSDAGLANFKDCKGLTSLWLGACTHVTDAGLVAFKDCENLMSLNLWRTAVGDTGLGNFKDCKALTDLDLDGTALTDTGLANFTGRPLRALRIQDTGITDLTPLQGMALEEIRLTPKNITRGLDILRDMKSVKTIDVGNNQAFRAAEFWERYDKGEFKQ